MSNALLVSGVNDNRTSVNDIARVFDAHGNVVHTEHINAGTYAVVFSVKSQAKLASDYVHT